MTDGVRLRVGDAVHEGEAVTVAGVTARVVAAAVAADHDGEVTAETPPPGPLHEHVGAVRAGMGLRTRTALAAAGRSRGLETPHDDTLAAARERLDAVGEPDAPDLGTRRRVLSRAGADTDRLRERVAAARGRLTAGDEDAEPDLVSAVRELSEAETERQAARQRLDRARESAREARDRLERRRRLQDRVANLEREARAHLVDRLEEPFAAALSTLPGREAPADPFEADPVAAALALVRVGSPAAPVALEGAAVPFEGAGAARDWLGGPVVYVR